MIESRQMNIILKSWNKIRRKRLKNRVSEPNCSKPDCRLLKKTPKDSIKQKRMRELHEIKRKLNFHPWTQRASNRLLMQVTLHLRIRPAKISIRLKLNQYMMTSLMTYLQTRDTQRMLDAHVKRRKLTLSKINSVTGATTQKKKWIGRSMRLTWNSRRSYQPLLIREGPPEKSWQPRPKNTKLSKWKIDLMTSIRSRGNKCELMSVRGKD